MGVDRSERRHAYFWTQLDNVDQHLQELFDELGLSGEQRTSREQDFFKLISKAVQSHVSAVEKERDTVKQQCISMQQRAQKMMMAVPDLDWAPILGDLDVHVREEVGPPYTMMYESLKDVIRQLETVFVERKNIVNQVVAEIKDLAVKMEESQWIQQIERTLNESQINLSQASIEELNENLRHLQGEYEKRVARMAHCATVIVSLWTELGTPQHEIDRNIVQGRSDVKLLGARKSELHRLVGLMQTLEKEKDARAEKLANLRQEVSTLWSKLSEDDIYVQQFVRSHIGLTREAVEAYNDEYNRLQEKKREHMQLFIEDARKTLNELWNKLFMSDEEVQQFTPAFTNIYTDASLDAHESEIARLSQVYEDRKPLLALVETYYDLCRDEQELMEASRDSSRLMSKGPGRRDPGRLLKEEQMRNRVQRKKPKVLNDLRTALIKFETQEGRPFLVPSQDSDANQQDQRLLDVLDAELNKISLMQGRRMRSGSSLGRAPSITSGPGSAVSTPGSTPGSDYMRPKSQASVRSAGTATPSLRRPPSEMRSNTSSRLGSHSPTKKPPTPGSPPSSSMSGVVRTMHRSERSFDGKNSSSSLNNMRQNSMKRAESALSYTKLSPNSNSLQAQRSQHFGSTSTSTSASENWETYGEEGNSSEDDDMGQEDLGRRGSVGGGWGKSQPGRGMSRITNSVAGIRMEEY